MLPFIEPAASPAPGARCRGRGGPAVLGRLRGAEGSVGRQDDVVQLGERMVGLDRLRMKYVKPGAADAARGQSVDQRRLVDEGACARGVDEDGARLDARDPRPHRVNPAGLVAQHEVEGDQPSERSSSSSISTCGTATSGRGVRFQPITFMPMPALDTGDLPSDAAETDEAPRVLAEEAARRSSRGCQRPVADLAASGQGDVAGAGEHQRNGCARPPPCRRHSPGRCAP